MDKKKPDESRGHDVPSVLSVGEIADVAKPAAAIRDASGEPQAEYTVSAQAMFGKFRIHTVCFRIPFANPRESDARAKRELYKLVQILTPPIGSRFLLKLTRRVRRTIAPISTSITPIMGSWGAEETVYVEANYIYQPSKLTE